MLQRIGRGLSLAALSFVIFTSMGGCATEAVRTETIYVDVPVYAPLPSELTEPVPYPQTGIKVWDDVVQLAEELKAALRIANAKLLAIKNEQP